VFKFDGVAESDNTVHRQPCWTHLLTKVMGQLYFFEAMTLIDRDTNNMRDVIFTRLLLENGQR